MTRSTVTVSVQIARRGGGAGSAPSKSTTGHQICLSGAYSHPNLTRMCHHITLQVNCCLAANVCSWKMFVVVAILTNIWRRWRRRQIQPVVLERPYLLFQYRLSVFLCVWLKAFTVGLLSTCNFTPFPLPPLGMAVDLGFWKHKVLRFKKTFKNLKSPM